MEDLVLNQESLENLKEKILENFAANEEEVSVNINDKKVEVVVMSNKNSNEQQSVNVVKKSTEAYQIIDRFVKLVDTQWSIGVSGSPFMEIKKGEKNEEKSSDGGSFASATWGKAAVTSSSSTSAEQYSLSKNAPKAIDFKSYPAYRVTVRDIKNLARKHIIESVAMGKLLPSPTRNNNGEMTWPTPVVDERGIGEFTILVNLYATLAHECIRESWDTKHSYPLYRLMLAADRVLRGSEFWKELKAINKPRASKENPLGITKEEDESEENIGTKCRWEIERKKEDVNS